ncbi:hypothetical protein BSZ40_00070 [Buchananella hordeovulneris]|uniref:Uncharacterized protein n=1 Tax=Buchananella hordeovulneris TaxID=52770 RepID=A0A1Q5PY76_9ACTO|nr:hypothetical protein BSZ40_00070 [Buchananella hordeovulneris]
MLWPRNKRASFELSPGMAEFGLDISGPDGYGFTDSTWFDGCIYRYFWGEFNTHIYYEGDCYKVADTDRG